MFVRFIVGIWRKYNELHLLALVALFLIAVFTGNLFTTNGLFIVLIAVLYLLVYLLDKWLKKVDEE